MSAHLFHIIESAVLAGDRSLDLSVHVLQLLLGALGSRSNVLTSTLKIVLFVPDLHNFTGRTFEILLQLLKLSAFLEKSFRSGTALVFQDLLSLKIGTFSTLHELVSVVLVPDLQVVEGIGKCLDLLLTFADFTVKLVTIALKFFLLLGSLNYEICLSVLSVSFDISRAGLITLDKTFVLNPEILDLLGSQLQFDSNLVALLFSSLLFTFEDVLMDLDLLFTFVHGHLELVLTVLQSVNSVSGNVDSFS